MRHIMLDLETLSSKPHAAILSIGAVRFDPNVGAIAEEDPFYAVVDYEAEYPREGFHVEERTVIWWNNQSDAARIAITDHEPKVDLRRALINFKKWVRKAGGDPFVWAKGCGFDNIILNSAYNTCGISTPWKFRNDRDVRTMEWLGKQFGIEVPFSLKLTAHCAADDALHQARVVVKVYEVLKDAYRCLSANSRR